MARITHVVKRTGAVVPFNQDRITNAIYRAAVAVGGRDREIAQRLSDLVLLELEAQSIEGQPPTVEEIQDVVEKVLIENGHARTAKAYILYRDERARSRERAARKFASDNGNIPWKKLWHVLDWTVDHGVNTTRGLNERIARGEFPEIIREANHAYNEDISCASEIVRERRDRIRVVVIAGPSSSGKTTTTIKLSHLLSRMGLSLVPLTVDNYFYDLEMHPRDEFGDYDYETPQALDLELISKQLGQLIAGQEVLTPFYDFKTGKRHLEHTPMKLASNEVILIDSLHGLYPPMMQEVAPDACFKLYIEPLMQLKDSKGRYVRWTDIRLMRRMLRDATHRAYGPRQTLEHWHYVRSSELRNIIPYVNSVDYIVNSALPYELPLFKARLGEQFQQWKTDYADDPLRRDAFMRSERICELFQEITAVGDDSDVPADSLLREFIGGSCYEY